MVSLAAAIAACTDRTLTDAATSGPDGPGDTANDGPTSDGTPRDTDDEPFPPEDACSDPAAECDGCERWSTIYDGPQGRADGFRDLARLAGGDLVVTGIEGRSYDPASPLGDAIVVRYTPDGTLVWQTSLPIPDASDTGVAIVSDSAGDIIVATGLGTGLGTLWKLDANGEVRNAVAGPGPDGGTAASIATDGTDFVVSGGGGATQAFLQRHASDFSVLWTLDGDAFGDPVDGYGRVDVAADGDILASGYRAATDQTLLVRISSAGDVRWLRWLDPGAAWVDDVTMLSDERVVFVGARPDEPSGTVPLLGLLGPEGDVRWLTTLAPGACCANALSTLAVTPQGRVFATGVLGLEEGGLEVDVFEVDLDCDGRIAWQVRVESSLFGAFPGGLVADDDGVFVAGTDDPLDGDGSGFLQRLDPG